MITSILLPEIQDFINKNLNEDLTKLVFKKNPFPDLDYQILLNQIQFKSKAKSKSKLPTFFEAKNIVFPSKISIEQTSSETTANYKTTIVSGENIIDLTGGFGIDTFYFSKKIKQVFHCESNTELSEIVAHNFKILKVDNCTFYNQDSLEVLQKLNQKFSWIYIDPARRNGASAKVFKLQDCFPNVPIYLDNYFEFTDNILIKTAPLLDIAAGLLELKFVKRIDIVAVNNEVKEILWVLEKNYTGEIQMNAINIQDKKTNLFSFIFDRYVQKTELSLPLKYLYEPNAAIMKSGGFNQISQQFELKKLHVNSHLFTSDSIIDFPGRIFEIENNLDFNKNNAKKYLENSKMNITTRNFNETVENIRKKWKIVDGGNIYSFFTTDANDNKIVLICKKI